MPRRANHTAADFLAGDETWLEELAEMASRPRRTSRYLDDAALRRIRARADASYRRADRELQNRFPQFYPGREHGAGG